MAGKCTPYRELGILPFIAGAILLLGAMLYKPTKKTGNSTALPSMRDQSGTIPPHYDAREHPKVETGSTGRL